MQYNLSIQVGDVTVPILIDEDFDKAKTVNPFICPQYIKAKWHLVEYIDNVDFCGEQVLLYRFSNSYTFSHYIAYVEKFDLQVTSDNLITLSDKLLRELNYVCRRSL